MECVLEKKAVPVPAFAWVHDKQTHTDLLSRRVRTVVSSAAYMRHTTIPPPDLATSPTRCSIICMTRWSHAGHQWGTHGRLPQGTKLQYPHHRGLFFGFNRVQLGRRKEKGRRLALPEGRPHLAREVPERRGRHRCWGAIACSWTGMAPQKQVFAHEQREVTVYNVGGGTLVEWSTLVKTQVGPVKLDGDPQHAGFHFRAANEVASTREGDVLPASRRQGRTGGNSQLAAHKAARQSAVERDELQDRGRTLHRRVSRSSIEPARGRHSERAYGRFGCYFEYELTAEKPLN